MAELVQVYLFCFVGVTAFKLNGAGLKADACRKSKDIIMKNLSPGLS